MSDNLIEASLELAAERCDDITPLVYRRLFDTLPETQAMFWRDQKDLIKGEMLTRVIMALIDFAGPRAYAASLVQCEVIRHENEIECPPDMFGVFFGIVAQTVEALAGDDWTPAMAAAWARLLEDLAFYVAHPDQYETASLVAG